MIFTTVSRSSLRKFAACVFTNTIFFFIFHFFSPSQSFLIEGVPRSKTYLVKADGSAKKSRGRHLSRLCRPFRGPLAAILDFEGGAALQVVSECTRRRAARLAFNHLIIKHFYMVFEIARISSMLSVYVYHTIN